MCILLDAVLGDTPRTASNDLHTCLSPEPVQGNMLTQRCWVCVSVGRLRPCTYLLSRCVSGCLLPPWRAHRQGSSSLGCRWPTPTQTDTRTGQAAESSCRRARAFAFSGAGQGSWRSRRLKRLHCAVQCIVRPLPTAGLSQHGEAWARFHCGWPGLLTLQAVASQCRAGVPVG